MPSHTTNGLRVLLISGLTRQQKINFIQRKESSYIGANFSSHSDEQLRQLAITVDKKIQSARLKNKKPLSTSKTMKQGVFHP